MPLDPLESPEETDQERGGRGAGLRKLDLSFASLFLSSSATDM